MKFSEIIQLIFVSLNDAGVKHAVLRGAKDLPFWTKNDIDLLVAPDNIDDVENVLSSICLTSGWRMVRVVDKYGYRCCLLISDSNPKLFLPIDILGGCFYRFHRTTRSDFALNERVKNENGIWTVSPGHSSAESIAKELMRHDHLKESAYADISTGARQDPEGFTLAFSDIVTKKLSDELLELASTERWQELEALAADIRLEVKRFRLAKVVSGLRFYYSSFTHTLNAPMGFFVVLLGPDGSGKSSTADALAEALVGKPFKLTKRYERRFQILPNLRDIFRPHVESTTAPPGTKGSGMNSELGALKACLYSFYYTLDYMLGTILLQVARGRGGVVIFSRYFYDFGFQKGYANIPKWLLNQLERFVPKPDLVVFLDRDSACIYEDKPELDIDEVERQQKYLRNFVPKSSKFEVYDSSNGLSKTVEELKIIIQNEWLGKQKITLEQLKRDQVK